MDSGLVSIITDIESRFFNKKNFNHINKMVHGCNKLVKIARIHTHTPYPFNVKVKNKVTALLELSCCAFSSSTCAALVIYPLVGRIPA